MTVLSKNALSRLVVFEKIFGIVILIIGFLMTYDTYNNMNAAGLGANIFLGIGIALIIIGLIFIAARPS